MIRTQDTAPYGVALRPSSIRLAPCRPRKVVQLLETEVDLSGFLSLAYCGEALGYADMPERLREDDVIAENGLPYLRFIDAGYFRIGQDNEILVTPEGQVWLAGCYPNPANITPRTAIVQ